MALDYTDEQIEKISLLLAPVTCEWLHPGKSHWQALYQRLISSLKRSLKLYVPVYTLPVLLFRFRQLYKKPYQEIDYLMKDIMRSTLMLTTICMLGRIYVCSSVTLTHKYDIAIKGSAFSIFGLLVEKAGRRCEMCIWGLTRGLPAIANFFKRRGYDIKLARLLLPIFCIANAVLTYAYTCEKDCVRKAYQSILTRFYGNN